jgi:hypothetical protein
MITLKEQEIYRILQTKDPAIAMLEGYGIKKKVKMFVEKNPHYQNINFTINDYDKQIYSEATRSMVRGLLLNGYSQQDIYGINRQINKLAESFYRMPLHKILKEDTIKQVQRLLQDTTNLDILRKRKLTSEGIFDLFRGKNSENKPTENKPPENKPPENKPADTSKNKEGGDGPKAAFLMKTATSVMNWIKEHKLENTNVKVIAKLQHFISSANNETDDRKKLAKIITGWVAIISTVVGAAMLAKWLVKLFLKVVGGPIVGIKKFFGIFSSKTKIPVENE